MRPGSKGWWCVVLGGVLLMGAGTRALQQRAADDRASNAARRTELQARALREQHEGRLREALVAVGRRHLERERELAEFAWPQNSSNWDDARRQRDEIEVQARIDLALDRDGAAPSPSAALSTASPSWLPVYGAMALGLGLAYVLTLLAEGARRRQRTEIEGVLERVSRGEDARLSEAAGGKVEPLALALNRTVDALQAARRELEGRVDDKTRALGLAFEESRALNARLQEVLAALHEAQGRLVLQEKMAALGTLSGGIAHEFNNILGGIRGCIADLEIDLSDADALETLAVVRRAVDRGRKIVEGLRQFSFGGDGAAQDVTWSELFADLTRLLQGAATAGEVELLDEAHAVTTLRVDRSGLEQVLTNLMLNAIQASPQGAQVQVTVQSTADEVLIDIMDRGPGIPPEMRARVFEPFFTTREREGGSGLGLAVSHGIIQALGGRIEIQARDGGGTIFRVAIPDRRAAESES